MASTPLPRRMNLAEGADYVGISVNSLRRRIADGSLPARRIGRRVVVDRADLDRLGEPVTIVA